MSNLASIAEERDCFAGLLIGTAVGDALGLPAEGMSRGRIQRRWHGRWKHRFLFGRGMISDDTEHTLFVAQALLAHPTDAAEFQRSLSWKLRLWLLGLPAGIGLATLKSILRLWLGFSPQRSGVWSAGNGPAMRSALLGAYFAGDEKRRRSFVTAATRLTHTDPRAKTAALAVAEAAAWIRTPSLALDAFDFLANRLSDNGQDPEWEQLLQRLTSALHNGQSVSELTEALGLHNGVTGYAYHTVPVALYAWLRHRGDFRGAVESVLNCGGDTDTVAAVVGALAGMDVGPVGIPAEWRDQIAEWPRSDRFMQRVAERLQDQQTAAGPLGPVRYFWPALFLRNGIFIVTVLLHGVRRLLPPF